MNEKAIKFINDIIKPWEELNLKLTHSHAVDADISDFSKQASALAVSIAHLHEFFTGISPYKLCSELRQFEIICDLADSGKHGILNKRKRQCTLSVGSMHERNDEGKVRFLRTVINIHHATYQKIDFMTCAMEAAKFVAENLSVKTSWAPSVKNNNGKFSNEITVHISRQNQVAMQKFQLQIVKKLESGEYIPVDLDSTVLFKMTADR